ncbi:MAG TPA: DUF2283 domain-containing protein [Nitrospiria bacterium]|nr:DUF2283 domain-containing protein [Nitrospiria bacterium]
MEKVNKITICYDSNDDILDIIIGPSAQEAISVEQEEEVFLRIHPESKEILGITILGFKKYLLEDEKKGKRLHEFVAEIAT